MQRSTFSRDETEWGAFGDAFGASIIPSVKAPSISAPSISAPSISRPAVPTVASTSQSALRTTGAGNVASGVNATGLQAPTARNIMSVKPGTNLSDLLAAIAYNTAGQPAPARIANAVQFSNVPPPATVRINVAPVAGNSPTKNTDTLANILAGVALHSTGQALPAPLAQKVSFTPITPSSTASVKRATGPVAPAGVSTAPTTTGGVPGAVAALQTTRNRGSRAANYAPVQGVISQQPMGRVQRSSGSVMNQVQVPTVTTITTLYDVTNGGKIVRNPSGVDTVNPQWLVYSTGQVIRLG